MIRSSEMKGRWYWPATPPQFRGSWLQVRPASSEMWPIASAPAKMSPETIVPFHKPKSQHWPPVLRTRVHVPESPVGECQIPWPANPPEPAATHAAPLVHTALS